MIKLRRATRDAGADRDAGPKPGPPLDGGELTECVQAAPEVGCEIACPETCNGLDDDCDSLVDEAGRNGLCALANATGVCADGACVIAACDGGHVDCNEQPDDGCEATLDSPEHCGLCGRACEFPNAQGSCQDGECALGECEPGFGDCDSNPDNGCENALDSVSDCGACGNPCTMLHAVTSCSERRCAYVECAPGFGDCNDDGALMEDGDGCESPLETPSDCGACGAGCSGLTMYCTGGSCTALQCEPGTADCDRDNLECESDLRSLSNCGGCGVSCGPLANADASCASRTCTAICHDGWSDCDGLLANGCEVDIRTTSDCGSCGVRCSYANATTNCDDGTCRLTSCNGGFGDCNDELPLDGCEQRLNTAQDCAGCDSPCSLPNAAATSCESGSCQVSSCVANFGNCDGRADNGCEAALQTSNQHCGGCNVVCPANRTCMGGSCVCTADAGCPNGQRCCANQCIDTRIDEANCGACGSQCMAGQTCCNSSCEDLESDFANCGACGRSCDSDSANRCVGGECRCANGATCPLFQRCCANGCRLGLLCL